MIVRDSVVRFIHICSSVNTLEHVLYTYVFIELVLPPHNGSKWRCNLKFVDPDLVNGLLLNIMLSMIVHRFGHVFNINTSPAVYANDIIVCLVHLGCKGSP